MGAYRLGTGIAAAALLIAATACQSVTEGHGTAALQGPATPSSSGPSGSDSPTATPKTSATPSPTATPSPSATPTPSDTPTPTAEPSAPPAATTAHPAEPAVAAPAAAVKALHDRGFDPAGAPTWYPHHTLNALVGVKHDSADGYFQYGFFFVRGRYIGRDTKEASAAIRFVSGTDRMVTLQYAIYRPDEPNCCPSARSSVRYLWNGQQLVPLDPIPSTNGTGRRFHS